MKLVALIEKVNQKGNKNLIGSIVIVDSELTMTGDYELCYQEEEHTRVFKFDNIGKILQCFHLYHSVANVSIIGVLLIYLLYLKPFTLLTYILECTKFTI